MKKQTQLDRIEAKLDQSNAMLAALLDAMADEGAEEQEFDLDGNPLDNCERDEDQPL